MTPLEQSNLVAPIGWLVSLATGQLAILTATIAVAVVGFAMLDGRVDWRRGARVAFGCFLLFGAAVISSAFMAFGDSAPAAAGTFPQTSPTPIAKLPDNDPWAHAGIEPSPDL